MTYRAELYRRYISNKAFSRLLADTFCKEAVIGTTPRGETFATSCNFLFAIFSPRITIRSSKTYANISGGKKSRIVNWSNPANWGSFIDALSAHGSDEKFVVHLHGTYDQHQTVVLTDSDYLDLYHRSEETWRILFAVFAMKRVVFVGFGLNAPDLMQILQLVAGTLRQGNQRHFVISPLDEPAMAEPTRRRLEDKYSIVPVFYPTRTSHGTEECHQGLADIITALKNGSDDTLPDIGMPPRDGLSDLPGRGRRGAHLAKALRPSLRRRCPKDPEDPHKGQWGGEAQSRGRKLSATVRSLKGSPGWYEVELTVSKTGLSALQDPVRFHLLDTFDPDVLPADDEGAERATLTVWAIGAFTVGVDFENEPTTFELDLPMLPKAPRRFRKT